jgi:sec-independent protein translocase protein TatB
MFDVGFWELCLVGLVSLIVIGPERLPKAARIAGFWVGKTRNMVHNVKMEIKEEFQAEELRQTLKEQQDKLEDFKEMANNIAQSGHSTNRLKERVAQEAKDHTQGADEHDRK